MLFVLASIYLLLVKCLLLKNDSTELVDGGIEAQTHQVMKNLLEVLDAAGSSLEKVIFARVYLVNFGDFDKMNSVYASYFCNR